MIIYDKNGSILKVHDIFDDLPIFMKNIDVLFTDLPYNQNLLTNFSNRQPISEKNTILFDDFIKRYFECVEEIKPEILFIEIGKEHLAEIIIECKKRFKYVTFYNNYYYNNKNNYCYIVHSTNNFKQSKFKELNNVDEENAIETICKQNNQKIVGDLCIGKGLVAYYSNKYKGRFLGTELNLDRLLIAKERVIKNKRSIGGR